MISAVDVVDQVVDSVSRADSWTWMKACGWIIAGLLLRSILLSAMRRYMDSQANTHKNILYQRAVSYGIIFIFSLTALSELGFESKILLGAAGILSVAIGFASQTSASNLISGLFLLSERSLKIGDVIRIDGIRGEIIAIDWLSIKLRTFDNLYVRVPNESLIKGNVVNYSKFAIRRVDLYLNFAPTTELAQVHELLMQLAASQRDVLREPEPQFFRNGISLVGVETQFSVWVRSIDFFESKARLIDAVLAILREHQINIVQTQVALPQESSTTRIPYP
ncbi:mechanosensitive ion channel family protein [Idiomarina xiamenensis]|uniref:Small-conductance mechanosensitive channel n=1 Tax=Idiomarina xiamenensis 10-D-4 TaxID=740709 RepID=K2KSD0_9GAMM|nr:mechanosensitive ion channel family protein [Idiomarina xiamenensis]EKE85269.1 MscS mechanosensitive ion channel [Idiomarina xiamenensis 10-D-4]